MSGHTRDMTLRASHQISSPWELRMFWWASLFTTPICKSHEYYRRLSIVDDLEPTATTTSKLFTKVLLSGCFVLMPIGGITSLAGIGLRSLAAKLQTHPYLYLKADIEYKTLPLNRTFTILSWNICCVGGGYSISDGGVLPWAFRIEAILQTIINRNADVICLYETFDFDSAFHIFHDLKEKCHSLGYVDFYFNIGPHAVGVNSGIFVASKFRTKNPSFTLFPKTTLVGRTKAAAKGVFDFDLASQHETFARVFSTHLQHSEICIQPTQEEIKGRNEQMLLIAAKMRQVADNICPILTGDLNLDDQEYKKSSWNVHFSKGDQYQDPHRTWGGDKYCANLMGKPVSTALNLDHTMVWEKRAKSISTSLVPTGFDANQIKKTALSDHEGLLSAIVLHDSNRVNIH